MKKIRKVLAASTLIPTITLAGCSANDDQHNASQSSVQNCGHTVDTSKAPERVTVMDPSPMLTLDKLGVLDKVTARAGVFPHEYYPADTAKKIDAIPSLSDRLSAEGHLEISQEAVAATNPDLVMGSTDTVTWDSMSATHTPVVVNPGFCGAINHPVSFDDVYDDVTTQGKIFHRDDQAQSYIRDLKGRMDQLKKDKLGHQPTVAVLYPAEDGSATYAYGAKSMSNPVVEEAGLKNVFGDTDKRLFEVSPEQIAEKNPDMILALHTAGDGESTTKAVETLKGAENTTAVKEHHIMPLLLAYAEPPTPIAVDGAEKVHEFAKHI